MAKLLRKEEVKGFKKAEELRSFVKLQEGTYKWIMVDTSKVSHVALEDMPICIPMIRDEMEIAGAARKVAIASEVSNDTIAEQMADTKLALAFSVDGSSSLKCYPVGPTAYRGVFQRLGADCSALTSLKNTKNVEEVPPTKKATTLNLLSNYAKGKSLLLIGDEMVLADMSTDYVRLPFSKILDCTEKELNSCFEYVRYINGSICHESSSCEFMFRDSEVDNKLYEAFLDIGIDISDYNAHIKVLTSDVGLSGANIYPFIRSEVDGTMISIGTPIKLEHIGSADIEKFKLNLLSSFASFKDVAGHIEEMKATRISNPASCLYQIGRKLLLPEKLLRDEIEVFDTEYPYFCKASDIYIRLFDILDTYKKDADEKISEIKFMQLSENITRICFYSISKFDMPLIR